MSYFHIVKHTLTILFILLALGGFSQQYSFKTYGVEDGLPVSTINDIVQDPTGFLWVATEGGGVVKFDGNLFQSVDLRLPSPFVSSLLIEGDSIWVGTEKGLVLHSESKIDSQANVSYLEVGKVNKITREKDGLYVCSRNGLFSYQEGAFKRIHSFQNVYDVIEDHGAIILAGQNGLFSIMGQAVDTLSTRPHKSIVNSKRFGVVVANDVEVYSLYSNMPKLLARDIRTLINVEEKIYAGSYFSGFYSIDDFSWKAFKSQNGLQDEKVRVLFQDFDHNIWIGSLSRLSQWVDPSLYVLSSAEGLLETEVWTVQNDNNGIVWFGSSKGITGWDGSMLIRSEENISHPTGVVLDIVEWKNTLWLATENGLFKKDHRRILPIGDQMSLPKDFIFSLCVYNGKLVVATGGGIYISDGSRFEKLEGLEATVTQMTSRGNNLYIATASQGVFRFSEGQFSPLSIKGISLDSTNITHIEWVDDQLLVSTSNKGLWFYSSTKSQVLNEDRGLVSDLVWSTIQVSENEVWVGSEKGVQVLHKEGGVWKTGEIHGGNSAELTLECNVSAAAYNQWKDQVLFGTTKGLVVIERSKMKQDSYQGKVQIKRIDLFFNENTKWSEYSRNQKPWVKIPEEAQLPYDQNYLRFSFILPLAGDDVEYRYRLIGQDEKWTELGGTREAVFTNVSPGKYTFSVQSKKVYEEWPTTKTDFSFTITPPFWLSWWFIVSVSVFLFLIAYYLIQLRIKRAKQALAIENEIAELERKALRLQMNPHFVFNALDAISGFIFKNDPEQAVKYLNSFAKLMRLTLENSREHLIPLQSEISLLTHYLTLESLRFKGKFTYSMEVDDELDPYEVSIPPMLIQPHIENAILHGLRPKEIGDGKLEVSFKLVSDQILECSITDNGVGRDMSKKKEIKETGKKSLATEITKERIELLNKSKHHKLSFSIIDLKDEEGNPAGTRVVLIIPVEEDF